MEYIIAVGRIIMDFLKNVIVPLGWQILFAVIIFFLRKEIKNFINTFCEKLGDVKNIKGVLEFFW